MRLIKDDCLHAMDELIKEGVNFEKYTINGKEDFQNFTRDTEINKKRGLSEDTITDNLLIKGNNLLVLHSLVEEFRGKVKLIYIDPPYNTGNDSFNYNDKFNHSTWLCFMKNRLEIAKELLSDDGLIFIQCDDNEQAYLKVLMDEIFRKQNFINCITTRVSPPSGVKMAHKYKTILKEKEYILCYSKNETKIVLNPQYRIKEKYDNHYNNYIINKNDPIEKWKFISVKEKLKQDNVKFDETLINNDFLNWLEKNKSFIWQSIAQDRCVGKGENNFEKIDDKIIAYKGRLVFFLENAYEEINGKKQWGQLCCDLYTDILLNNLQNEGAIIMKNGKKPEALMQRIIAMVTNPNDIILDFFSGSGTTGAVAHKMNRQWIMVEQMDYIETITKERIKKVIEGEQGGISKSVNWQGGGEFVYFELKKDFINK